MGWKMSRYFYETIWNRNNVARQSGTAGKAGYGAYETVTRSTINRHIPHSHPSKHCHFVNQVKFFLNGMWYVYFSRNSSWAYDKSSHPYDRVIHKGFWIKIKLVGFRDFVKRTTRRKKFLRKWKRYKKNPCILPFYSIFLVSGRQMKRSWMNDTTQQRDMHELSITLNVNADCFFARPPTQVHNTLARFYAHAIFFEKNTLWRRIVF